MHLIDGPGHDSGNFRNGDPSLGQESTEVTADWLNTIQHELANIVIESGESLDKGDLTQVVTALNILFAAATHNHDSSYAAVGHTHNDIMATLAAMRVLPVGAVLMHQGLGPLTGTLVLDEGEIGRTTYADLWTYAQNSGNLAASEGEKTPAQFGPGDGSTTFTLTDPRGEGVRFLDGGRGVDVGRQIGQPQLDAIQTLTGRLASGAGRGQFANSGNTGVFGGQGYSSLIHGSGDNAVGYRYIDFNAALVARTAAETRMRNHAFTPCIVY